MAIEIKQDWIKMDTGDWVNRNHIDLIEVTEKGGTWRVVAWNALQPQVEGFLLSTHKSEQDARKALNKLIDQLTADSQ